MLSLSRFFGSVSVGCSWLLFLGGLGLPAQAMAPVGFVETTMNDSALGGATGMAWAPDGSNRLFVIKKGGTVRVVQNGAVLPTVWAEIEPIYETSECGLIGFCFDPDFVTNGYVYFFVTVSGSEQQIIRYREQGGVGVEKTVLVQGLPTAGANHDGGAIAIGSDGHLYWAIGDNGNGTGVNSDLSSLASKIGRANRFTGAPVADNPFADGGGANNEYIWARGFRNPFTMTMHPVTGDLWVNVVGTGYEQVFVPTAGSNAGYNTYENNQPDAFLQPVIAYRTNGSDQRTIPPTGVSRTAGITTITTSTDRKFRVGEKVTISGVGNSSFNGTFFVRDLLSSKSFTFEQTGQPDATSGGGTVQSAEIGGCITGGCFYDSTLFPAEYRGNFFFGDYNSANISRVTLDSSTNVTSVDGFVTAAAGNVDVTTGPDGALYYLGQSSSTLKKLVPQTVAPTLVVQPTSVRVEPGGASVFTVRLSEPPAGTVTVSLTKLDGGDPDLSLTGSTTLQFTAANWDQLQTVRIDGAVNTAPVRGNASFRAAADGGFGTYDVLATELAPGAVPPQTTLLYKKGDSVPGEPVANTFESFGLPSIDGDQVGFDAVMLVDKKRVPVIVGGDPARVLWRVGDTAPGLGTLFTKLSDPIFNGGHLAFLGTAATGDGVTGANNSGLWSDVRGTLTLVAQKGMPAPGTDGAKYASVTALNLPEVGGVVYLAKLAIGSGTTAPKVNAGTDLGLWREKTPEAELLLREGGQIEVAAGDLRKVRSFQVLPNVVGSPDQRRAVRADGTVGVYVTFTDNSQALVEFPPGGNTPVLLTLTPKAPSQPVLKSLGLLAEHGGAQVFRGTLNAVSPVTKSSDTGIFSVESGGAAEAAVQEGSPLTNPSQAQFSLLETPAFAGGELMFAGTLRAKFGDATSKNDRGLWITMNGPLGPLAREGQAVGGKFLASFVQYAGSPESSAPAVVGFTAKLRRGNGVTASNDSGIVLRRADGTLSIVRRKGDEVELAPGGATAKVSAINAFQTTSRTYGQGRSVSRTGKLVYRATLGKAGQAVFLVELP